ncbi:MAG: type II toxin-antitoxin system VapC family toxin [Planctomycetota bacterium]|nr:type II toxin-antitoxin system VapC family toxin [Planctomycetota bacterium]
MTLRPDDLISLDTNVLVHWIRQNDTGIQLRDTYRLHERTDRPIYSTIVEGELRALANFLKWKDDKVERLETILAELVRVDAGLADVVKAYADIYSADRAGGHNTGQNDMWIAATTKAAGAVLLTCDDDCVRMNPGLVAVEHVPTVKSS